MYVYIYAYVITLYHINVTAYVDIIRSRPHERLEKSTSHDGHIAACSRYKKECLV